jgi:hypothetical protein
MQQELVIHDFVGSFMLPGAALSHVSLLLAERVCFVS